MQLARTGSFAFLTLITIRIGVIKLFFKLIVVKVENFTTFIALQESVENYLYFDVILLFLA